MTYDYHAVLAIAGIVLGVIGYWFYFASIFRGETKPHLFTWLVYFIADIIVFAAQALNNAGPGAWVTFTGLIGTFFVAAVALRYGEKHITKTDWVSFIAALFSIVLWRLTGDPLLSVVISAVINFLAMAPTFRKAYGKPYEESLSVWVADTVRYVLAIIALATLSLTTALFPTALVTGDSLLILMILIRRRQLGRVPRI